MKCNLILSYYFPVDKNIVIIPRFDPKAFLLCHVPEIPGIVVKAYHLIDMLVLTHQVNVRKETIQKGKKQE
jgi:hypothetical protein